MKSLSSRLTAWYALIVTLTVGVLLFAGRIYLEHNLIEGIDLLNEVEFEEIRSRLDNADTRRGPEQLVAAIQGHAELDAELYFFQIGRSDEDVIYRSSNLGSHYLPRAVHGHERITVEDDELGFVRSMEFKYAGLDIHIASSLNHAQALFHGYNQTSVWVCVLVFALSLVVGYLLSRLAIRPIAAIQLSAQRVTASHFNERIPVPNTGDEIERMAVLLNAMLDRLEKSYHQVKRFTAEASHELRTPLSIIRLQTEYLLGHPELDEVARERALNEQMEEVERLNKIIDDLLFLAKADAGVMPIASETVALDAYLSDFSADVVMLTEDRGVRFEQKKDDTQEWFFDPRWIRHVLLNLLTNALEVSTSGGVILLETSRQGSEFAFRISDEGSGLPEVQLERIFERFEQLDKSKDSRGNGLGLAICRSLVEQHGGTIRAYNRSDRSGLVVEVRLPAKPGSANGL